MNDKIYRYYRDLRKTKIEIGIIGTMLIVGLFGFLFMGFYKVTLGIYGTTDFNGTYDVLPTPLINENGDLNILYYTSNNLWVGKNNNTWGTLTENRIIVFNTALGKTILNFSLQKEKYTISRIFIPNPFENGLNEYFIVQYGEVNIDELNVQENEDGTEYSYNTTGNYQTFLFRIRNHDSIQITNISDRVNRSIITVVHLYTDLGDLYPDFVVATEGLQSDNDYRQSLYCYYLNGTFLWHKNVTGIDYGDSFLINFNDTALIYHMDNTLIVADSLTGNTLENYTLRGISHISDIFNGPDISGDGIPEIVISPLYYHTGENTAYSRTLFYYNIINNMSEKDAVSIPPESKPVYIPYREITDLNKTDTPGLVIWKDRENNTLNFLESGNELRIIGKYGIGSEEISGSLWEIMGYNHNLGAYIFTASDVENYKKTFIITYTDGKYTINVLNIKTGYYGNIVIADFLPEYPGLEFIVTDTKNGNYRIISPDNISVPFYRVSLQNTLLFTIFTGILGISAVLGILKRRTLLDMIKRKKDEDNKSVTEARKFFGRLDGTEGLRKFNFALFGIIIASSVSLFYFIFFANDQPMYGDPGYSAIVSIYVITAVVYIAMTFISVLYNIFSVRSAFGLVKFQSLIYKRIFYKFKKHRPVVLKMDYAEKHSPIGIFSRSLFALFISITIGLQIFNIMGTQQLIDTEGNLNPAWIAQFEIYAVLPMIITYAALCFIVPGTWLLDDAGIVYFEEPVNVNAPQDISKISDWFLNWLKGLFGFTAVVNYIMLFKNLASSNIIDFTGDFLINLFLFITVIGLNLILLPLIVGLLYMLAANLALIEDLGYNRYKLLGLMEKEGMDTTAYDLKDLFKRSDSSIHE